MKNSSNDKNGKNKIEKFSDNKKKRRTGV
jgi:hypothetical protein